MYSQFNGTSWSNPIPVREFDQLFTNPELPSQLAKSASGFAIAWPIRRGGSPASVALLVHESGTWREAIVPTAVGALYVTLMFSGDWMVLGYVGYSQAGEIGLLVTRSPDQGRTWSAPIVIAQGRAYQPSLIGVDGRLALMWLGERQNFRPQGLRIAFSDDLGQTWTASAAVPGGESTTAFATARVSEQRSVLLQQAGESLRREHRFVQLMRDSLALIARDNVDAATVPVLTQGTKDQVLAVWSSADTARGSAMPRTVLSSLRLSCGS